MSRTHEVLCPWCGKSNVITIIVQDETTREKCSSCERNYFVYETKYGVVVSPNDEHAWLK